jgi:DNA-binding GntR family transcriptional regulator
VREERKDKDGDNGRAGAKGPARRGQARAAPSGAAGSDKSAGSPVSVRARPSLQGISKLPARDRAYHELRYRILEGRLPPGTTLLETEVANLLSLSRTPVREALIRLEEEGLVEVRPRHGITVKALSIEEIQQIYEVFSALEVKAAQLTARRGISDADHDRLDGILSQMERATLRGDIEQWSELDDIFHSELVALCGNPRLQGMLRQLWDMQYRARIAIVKLRPLPVLSDAEHREILAAIRAGDEARTSLLHQRHRDRADTMLLSLLRGQSAIGAPS